MQYELLSMLPRTTSCNSNNKIVVASPTYATSSLVSEPDPTQKSIFRKTRFRFSTLLRSILTAVLPISHALVPTRRWLPTAPLSLPTPSLRRKLTGTLFGNRRGHVTFSIQDNPRSNPVLIIQLAITTSNLVKEMSSGLVRIALESDKSRGQARKLFDEPTWSMYCNGKKCGYAISRVCNEYDWHVLSTVGSVSAGAGVIPVVGDGKKGTESEGELMYMRAKFERVVGSKDSEAFYMMNPDGNGGPELSIFLLRI